MTLTLEKPLKDSFTSTGAKFFYHQEAMRKLSNGQGQPITCHVMPTDICQHTCAFCSVQTREGNVLPLCDIIGFVKILVGYGLKSVIISGGGNPILYRCPVTKVGFNVLAREIKAQGVEIGMITNGMPIVEYPGGRKSWKTVEPETLDLLTWVRISMSGLDHKENEVFVPDIDPAKTTLGFSYVYHDIYDCPDEPNHGKVSTISDLIRFSQIGTAKTRYGDERLPEVSRQIAGYVKKYNPRYVRLLPNCLEPSLIAARCKDLQEVANAINPDVVFVQYKPPAAPNKCFLGYIHPVLNSDGFVYPCDSCVLNEKADHKFANPWRVCHWSQVADLYKSPVHSLVDPKALCPGCVFTASNLLLESVVVGTADITPPLTEPTHSAFV